MEGGEVKLIIAGSRTLRPTPAQITAALHVTPTEVVSGTAIGVDRCGEFWAVLNKIPVMRFPAQWDTEGKAAGYLRNERMAKYADACLIFHDGKSRGTQHMIDLATSHGLSLKVVTL